MDITKIQTDLITNGYTHFKIKDYDSEMYNYLLPLRCNEYTDLKKYMVHLCIDGEANLNLLNELGVHINKSYDTFEIAEKNRIESINLIVEDGMFQAWHYGLIGDVLKPKGLDTSIFNEYIFDLVRECFGLDKTTELHAVSNSITYFDKGCKIRNHQDGNDEDRVCSLLIYLNQNYDETNGGCLVLENETTIVPEFGNVAIISLDKKFNVQHEVTEVIDGMGRYAICVFIKKK